MSKDNILKSFLGGFHSNGWITYKRYSLDDLKLIQSVGLALDLSNGQIYISWQCLSTGRAYQVSGHRLLLPAWVSTSIKLSTRINVISLDLRYHALREISSVVIREKSIVIENANCLSQYLSLPFLFSKP